MACLDFRTVKNQELVNRGTSVQPTLQRPSFTAFGLWPF